jgi:predicted outer membrane lipoprotein
MTVKSQEPISEPILREIHNTRMRFAFILVTLLTCGFGLIPWLIWEVVKKR